jgi:hypothetical protein
MATGEDRKLAVREDVLWRRLESEIVILNGSSWEYLGLNAAGGLLWEQLQDEPTVAQLAQVLVDTYALPPELAHADVNAFIYSLSAKDLLV